jgi:hypothetical protein
VRDGGRLGQGVLLGAGPLEENIWSLVNTTLTGRSTASTPDGAEEDITVPVRERRRQFDRTVRVDRRGLLSGNPCRTDGFVVGTTAVLQLLVVGSPVAPTPRSRRSCAGNVSWLSSKTNAPNTEFPTMSATTTAMC